MGLYIWRMDQIAREDERMNTQPIPVVFATDENYVVPTYIAAYSMLQNAEKNYYFDIYIMVPNDISEHGKLTLTELEKTSHNCKVHFLNMENAFQEIEMLISYITPATYYRLLLPDLLPQYEKCLYLDSDIIVTNDISEMYNKQKEDSYLTGVIAGNPPLSGIKGKERLKHAQKLEIETIDTYINAGVLVFNLKAMRDQNLVEKFMEKIPLKYPYQDQDILNSVCYKHIQFANRKFNVCPLNKPVLKTESILTDSAFKTILLAYNNPSIIHYAQPQKPWFSRHFPMASYWWEYYDSVDPLFKEKYLHDFIRKNRGKAIKVRLKHSKLIMGTWQSLKKRKNNR